MALAAFANERSAEEPTLHHGGVAINHQYSKSLAFERVLAAALAEAGATAQVISVLRPASELWIGQQLAALPEVWPRFASCNRNFVFAGPAALAEGQRWCRRCAKCVFTALILAPFVTPDQHEGIFGGRVLDDPANLDLARQNVGLTDAKPWDCVGEVRESAAALWKAASCGYRDQIVVSSLATELERRFGEAALAAWYDAALKLDSRGRVPTPIHAEMLRG